MATSRTKLSEGVSGDLRIQVYSPARDDEGKTATDKLIEQNRNKTSSRRSGGGSGVGSAPYSDNLMSMADTGTPAVDLPQSKMDDTQPFTPYIPPETKIVTFKDSSGRVVGIQDPVTQMSYATLPTSQAEVDRIEQERARAVYSTVPNQPPQQKPAIVRRQSDTFTPQGAIGVYRPATVNNIDTETQKIIKEQAAKEKRLNTPLVRQFEIFKDTFAEGFTYSVLDPYAARQSDRYRQYGGFDELAQQAGGFFGLYASAGVTAASVAGGAKLGTWVTGKAAKAFTTGNMLLDVGANVVGNIGATYATFETSKAITKAKQNIVNPSLSLGLSKSEKSTFSSARESEVKGQNFWNTLGFTFGLSGDKDKFLAAAEADLRNKGYTGERLTSSLKRLEIERLAVMGGTVSATLASGAFSEFTGRTAINAASARGAKPTFSTFGAAIAPAGFGEGFSQVYIGQQNVGDTRNFFTGKKERNLLDFSPLQPTKEQLSDPEFYAKYTGIREKTKFSTTPLGEAALGGGFGFVTSGVLGGFIGSTAAKGQRTRSALGALLGDILDPSEAPSDFVARFTTTSGRRAPVVSLTPAFTTVPTNAVTSTNVNNFVSTPANTNVPTLIESDLFSFVPSNVPEDNFVPNDVPSDSRSDNFVPTDTDTNTNINNYIFTDVPADVPSDVPTNINTNVNVNIPVPINRLYGAGIPLPLPFSFGSGGYGGVGRKARVGFINELDASTNIFRQQIGLAPVKQRRQTARKTATKKTARRATKRKAAPVSRRQNLSQFNRMAFGGF